MPDFRVVRGQDMVLTIDLSTPIGGMALQFQVRKHFGGESGLITKSMASGFYNVSGMNITNSGQGIMQAQIWGADTSGMAFGNLAYSVQRLTSGQLTPLAEGFIQLLPELAGG